MAAKGGKKDGAWWQTGVVQRITRKRQARTLARKASDASSVASSASAPLLPGGAKARARARARDAAWHQDAARAAVVIVMEHDEETVKWLQQEFVPRLLMAGLRCAAHTSSNREQVLLHVFAPLDRLLFEADRTNTFLKLDADALREADVRMNASLQRRGLQFNTDGSKPLDPEDLAIPNQSLTRCAARVDPYEFHYAPYHEGRRHAMALYEVDTDTGCFLSNNECLYLLLHIIEAPTTAGGAGWNLERLVVGSEHRVVRFFPAKFSDSYPRLARAWYKCCAWPWSAPFDDIRGVMGSEVALYFAFIAFLSRMLVWPAALGAAVFAVQAGTGNWTNVDWLPLVGVAVSLWCVWVTELWKRQQASYALEWGTTHFATSQVLRAEFMASADVQQHRSLTTGKPQFWASPGLQSLKSSVSCAAVSLSAAAVVAIVLSIFLTRAALANAEARGDLPHFLSQYSGTVINAIIIQVAGAVYKSAAKALNDWENHATDTAYRDALIVKRVVFDMVNNFTPLFYVIAKAIGSFRLLGQEQTCAVSRFTGQVDCLYELQYSVAVIFITRLVVGNAQELLLPLVMRCCMGCVRRCGRGEPVVKVAKDGRLAGHASQAELDAALEEEEIIEEHLEVLITYAYAAMFMTAFPLAPLLAMLSFTVETKVDAYKLLYSTARPVPRNSTDVGSWLTAYEVVGIASVVTNLLIVCFVGKEFFGITGDFARFGAFVGLQYAVFLTMYAVQAAVPDEPAYVALQKERMAYLVGKHIDGVPDEIISVGGLTAREEEDEGALDGVADSGAAELGGASPPSGYSTPKHPSGVHKADLAEAAAEAAGAFLVAASDRDMIPSPDLWSSRGHTKVSMTDVSRILDDGASVISAASGISGAGIALTAVGAPPIVATQAPSAREARGPAALPAPPLSVRDSSGAAARHLLPPDSKRSANR